MKKDYFTVTEAARLCRTSIWTLHRRIRSGSIKSFRAAGGRNVLIERQELLEFLKQNRIPYPKELERTAIRLLIVDDEQVVLDVLRRFFDGRADFEIQTADSGFSAGLAVRSFRPDVILLDIMLGDLDGREVCRRLRADPELAETRVLGFSGYVEADQEASLKEAGIDDFVSKPVNPAKLVDRILKLVGRTVMA